jgi:hypothetical protein
MAPLPRVHPVTSAVVDDPAVRAMAIRQSSYEPADRYILFELGVNEARCNGYGDVALPPRTRWRLT